MEPVLQDEYRMLSRLACEKIRGYIDQRQLKAGDKLPTERELAAQLEVSRPVIREALGTLEALGLIVKRQGKGIFLREPDFSVLFQEMMEVWRQDADSAEQLLQFRILLERASVESIIEQAAESDFERLHALIDQSEQEGLSINEFIRLDYLFHRELLGLTGNPLFSQLMDVINKYFLWVESNKANEGALPGMALTIRQHRELVQLMESREKEAAVRLLTKHLTSGKTEP